MVMDTDVLIDLQRKHPAALAWLASLTILPSLASFAAMELFADRANLAELQIAERFAAKFSILWPDEAALQQCLVDFGRLHLSHNIGIPDMLIAATALSHKLPLVTFNVKHYRAVPGLVTLQPYIPWFAHFPGEIPELVDNVVYTAAECPNSSKIRC